MEKAIAAIEDLVREAILDGYAVAGGMAAIFYVEPVLTYDLDVIVLLPTSTGVLVSLERIYRRLKEMGHIPDAEHVVIGGIPVQFLPAYNPLVEEAAHRCQVLPFGNTTVRVVSAEHLLAIMVQTGRPKDLARVELFLAEADFDRLKLMDILSRHGLLEKWGKFSRKEDS